jgi:hypothetical protein
MKQDPCIGKIVTLGGGAISEEQAQKLVNRLRNRAEKAQNFGENVADQLVQEAVAAFKEDQINAALARRSSADNSLKLEANRKRMANYPNGNDGLLAILGGSSSVKQGARNSVDYRAKAVGGWLNGATEQKLRTAGLWDYLRNNINDKQIAWELRNLSSKQQLPSQYPTARKVAEILHDNNVRVLGTKNRAGAWVSPLDGYITRQSHDVTALTRGGESFITHRENIIKFGYERAREMAYEKWRDFILPLLDHTETFNGMSPESALRETYKSLVTGKHIADQEESDALAGASRNLAGKVSASRSLIFKDAESWVEYNKRFGAGSLVEAVRRANEHDGRSIALMETFGANPRNMFEQLLADVKAQQRGDFFKKGAGGRLKDAILKPETVFNYLDGSGNIPDHPDLARFMTGVRTWQSMAKLGGVVLSSFPDIATSAATLKYNGMGLGEAYHQMLANMTGLGSRSQAEIREIGRLVGVGADSLLGRMHSDLTAADAGLGFMNKAAHQFGKWSGMHWWDNMVKSSVADILSHHIAGFSDRELSALPAELQRALSLYDVNAEDWNLLRRAVEKDSEGRGFIIPNGVNAIPENALADSLKIRGQESTAEAIAKLRDDLRTKLGAYFVDQAAFALPSGDAITKSILLRDTKPGSLIGEALRCFAQFKTFPVSLAVRILGRELRGYGADTLSMALRSRETYAGLAHIIAGATLVGMLSMWGKQLARGESPQPPTTPESWLTALTQGGGLGIYGDFLLSESNRYGQSPLVTLAGPTAGSLDDAMKIWGGLRQGKDEAAQAFRLAVNNTPFANMFYTRAAMNYLILDRMQEAVSPGYMMRKEQRLEDNGQKLLASP